MHKTQGIRSDYLDYLAPLAQQQEPLARSAIAFFMLHQRFQAAFAIREFDNPICSLKTAIFHYFHAFVATSTDKLVTYLSHDHRQDFPNHSAEMLLLTAASPQSTPEQVLPLFFAAVQHDHFDAKQCLAETSAYVWWMRDQKEALPASDSREELFPWLPGEHKDKRALFDFINQDSSLGLLQIPALPQPNDPLLLATNNRNPHAAVLLLLHIEECLSDPRQMREPWLALKEKVIDFLIAYHKGHDIPAPLVDLLFVRN